MKPIFTFLLAMALVGCGGPSSTSSTSSGEGVEATESPSTPQTKWSYSEKVNAMDDTKTLIAQIEAEDELEFDFPYNGGTKVWLTLRKSSSGTDVILSITKNKGQFIPATMGDKYITVRFDDTPAEKYSYTDPSDFSMETIFVQNGKKFITNLKNAKTVLVQCEFFDEGVRQIKFMTEGLTWEN